MTRFALVVGLVAAGCSSSDQCSLEDSIAAHVVIPDHDCGTLDYNQNFGQPADLAPYRAAHDCAISAIKTHSPFVVRWSVEHVDTGEQNALIGDRDGVRLFSHGYVIGGQHTGVHTCPEILDLGDCADPTDSLCLSCENGSKESPCD